MKEKLGLTSIRRLRYLLSISGAGRSAVCESSRILPDQLCSRSSSHEGDSSHITCPISQHEGSCKGQTERTSSSILTALGCANSLLSFPSNTPLGPGSPPVGLFFRPFSHPSSSFRLLQSSCRVSSAAFTTVSERVEEEEDETVVIVEKRGHKEPWVQGQQARDSSSEEISVEDTCATTAVRSDNGNSVKDCPDLSSLRGQLKKEVGWSDFGWTREEVFNWPNAISTARLLSGPLLAWMIVHDLWSAAFVGLVIGGVSDWLDGYVARKMGISSVLGSYLDPVADKFFVGSVAVAMAYTGLLHAGLVGLIVARDGVLMGGAFIYRAYSLGWQWKDWREFFKINVGGAQMVQPIFISKVNTVLQLALVGVALGQPALSMQDTWYLVPSLSWSVVVTTSLSWVAYGYILLKNPQNLTAFRTIVQTPDHKTS